MEDLCGEKCINEKKVIKTMGTLPEQEDIVQMADTFKALSDPTRLKIVLSLLKQEHCVCDIAVICNQTDSAISHQLRILSLHPGISVQNVIDNTGFELSISDSVSTTMAPTKEQMAIIESLDSKGLRYKQLLNNPAGDRR